jgi:hypothetical protein
MNLSTLSIETRPSPAAAAQAAESALRDIALVLSLTTRVKDDMKRPHAVAAG